MTMRTAVGLRLLLLVALVTCNRAPRATHPDTDAAAGSPAAPSTDVQWLIGPQPSADFLDANASEAALRARLGASVVRTDSIYVGEGQSELGTRLFPGDSARELAIVWTDTLARARPQYVYVTSPRSTWRLYPGVGMGSALTTIDSLNGHEFHLSGFGWDYSGTTISFDGGRLDSLWPVDPVRGALVLLRLDPSGSAMPEELLHQVEGDRAVSSRDSIMHLLNPRVYQILVRPR